MRILYQFPLSHFCEKARWLLDHKELDYVAQNVIPGVHRALAKIKTGQNNFPILRDQDRWIGESTQIALYLDEQYPEHTLLRADRKLREKAIELNDLANELGVCVRRWGLAHMIEANNEEALDIIIGEKGYLRKLEKISKPIIKSLVSSGYKVESEKVKLAKSQMDELVSHFNQILIENGGCYLVGDRLGLADIAVCSMFAPLLEVRGTPWEREMAQSVEAVFQEFQDQLLELPLGQYVLRIYQSERNARVDWRGV